MNPLLIISALLSFALGFGTAWKFQQGNIDHAESVRMAEIANQEQELRRMEQARSFQVIAAQNSAVKRESQLRVDAATAKSVVDELRTQSAGALLAARESHDACLIRADAFGVVFNQCVGELQTLAVSADLHRSDVQTLTEAWPK